MNGDGLSAGAVAQRLGVAVTTLRTWHQRYGLGPNGHVAGLHRRYTEEDIARLEVMRRLTARGVPAAEAARLAQSGSWADLAGPDFLDAVGPATLRPRDGGGHTVAVGRAGPAARGLARAATRLDSPMMRGTIAEAITTNGVIHTWVTMLCPVLVNIGAAHAATGRMVEVEHLLSRCISEALAAVPRGRAEPRVLLACAAEEQHSLPLEALAAALAERGVSSRLLGARVPDGALRDAVRRTGPDAVVVWSQVRVTGHVGQLHPILQRPHRPALVAAAGPGWPGALPSTVERPESLPEAVSLTLAATGYSTSS